MSFIVRSFGRAHGVVDAIAADCAALLRASRASLGAISVARHSGGVQRFTGGAYDLAIMMSVIAICIGASLGALARWRLGLWLSPGGVIPWGTLTANLVGAYLIGVAVATFQALPQLDPVWRLVLVTGFLGALTTFSSFSAEVVDLLGLQRYALALGTAGAHLLGSLLLTVAGMKTVTLFLASRA